MSTEPDLLVPGSFGPEDVAIMEGDNVYMLSGIQFRNSDIDQSEWAYA